MNVTKNPLMALLAALLAAAFPAPAAFAIDAGSVRDFDDVFVISAEANGRESVRVRWNIEEGYYLYNNQFLGFSTETGGVVLGEPRLPTGKTGYDELLGQEVEKYYGEVTVEVPLESVAPSVNTLQLKVRSQGCLEDELCYPPTTQVVGLALPAASGESAGASLLSGYEPPPLTAEEAFSYESIGYDAGTALVRFTMPSDHYLYADKLEFRVVSGDGFSVAGVDLPEGVIKDDPEFGPVPVYFGQVEVPVRLARPAGPATAVELEASFQGCRDGDICYPPMKRTAAFEMPASKNAVSAGPPREPSLEPAAVPQAEQDRLAQLLTSSPLRAVAAFFIAGLLLAFTPCVLPMIPILSGIIIGQGKELTTARAFWLSLVYVLAMAVTYTVAGVLAGLFGQNLQAAFQNPWIISGFVAIFVLLALSMFGFYELQLPARLQTRLTEASNQQKGGSLTGVAVMGFLSALIVGPCVAPPLMAALIVIGSSGDALLGGTALFALAMGMGLPLILFGVSAGKLVPRAGAWMNAVKAVFGVAMLGLSVWMLERILPGGIIMVLWGLLAIGCAVYLGALEPAREGSGWRKLWKSLGVFLLVLGVLELIGAAAGGSDWTRPLAGLERGSGSTAVAETHAPFQRIKSLADLDSAIDTRAAGRGTILDYYADWCVECKRMERNTFPEVGVAQRMDRFQLLQADVTANDETDQALMREFGIIGPPAILFFDRAGREMKSFRLVGYFGPEEFADHLDRVMAAW